MNRHLITSAAAAATLLTFGASLSGCASAGETQHGETADTESGTPPWITFEQSKPAGDDALIKGTIVKLHGCLAVAVDDDQKHIFSLAFSTSDPRPSKLEVGDQFGAAGGFVEERVQLPRKKLTFPKECAKADKLAIVSVE